MKIGSLIEAPGLYKNCTAYENMLRFSILYGSDKKEIDTLLKKVGLGNTGAKKAGEFSLGMRQRLGIAIALLAHPEVLILDEPINGLDPTGIKEIRDIILNLNKEGVTFVISSHLLDELAKIVTNYGIIADGKLAEEITAENANRIAIAFFTIAPPRYYLIYCALKSSGVWNGVISSSPPHINALYFFVGSVRSTA